MTQIATEWLDSPPSLIGDAENHLKIDLYYIYIGDYGATVIAEALKINSTLEELMLANNQIGDDGATAIAEALKINKALHQLDLCNNDIYVEGATAIADALRINATLRSLSLSDQNVKDGGAKAMAETMKRNSTLQQRFLFECSDNGSRTLVAHLFSIDRIPCKHISILFYTG